MCLKNFQEFKQVRKKNAVIGYRTWLLDIENPNFLKSSIKDYYWKGKIQKTIVKDMNSGIYSYNNHSYYNYSYYYNNNNNYNYNNYSCSHYYIIYGIIKQYGKVAIHSTGYRSQYTYIDTLFTIRKIDAIESEEFLNWVDLFNKLIEEQAAYYGAKTIHYQDYKNG